MSDNLTGKKFKGPIAWMTGHPVAANLLMVVALVGGFLAIPHIKQEVFPDLTEDIVSVSVPYPGASPEEVERGIVLAVEEAVRGLDGVDNVTSTANEGSGSVRIELIEGGDIQKLTDDVQSEIDRITTLPEDSEEPVVSILSRKRQVLQVLLYGEMDRTALHELAEQVRDDLLQSSSITQVEVNGLPPLEISIEISQDQLRRYGITLEQLADRVGKASVELPGGGIKTDGGELLVRMKERRDYGHEFEEIAILSGMDGSEVKLGDIAHIVDGFEDTDQYATYNDKPSVAIDVYRVGMQTPVDVAAAVEEQMNEISREFPQGVEFAVLRDSSIHFKERLGLLLKNGSIGLCLVFISLGLFLELRLAFWVMMGIPISFLGSLLVLPGLGTSINMVTMFAYIISLGIVVDDAIVVGENIYHYRQEGYNALHAAIKGARELVTPVTYSILTNIVAFLPLYFVPGTMGKIFKMIPMIVCTVFLISLLESLFILPSHLGHQKKKQRRGINNYFHSAQQWFSNGFTKFVRTVFKPILDYLLHRRYVVISGSVAILMIALAYAGSGRMGLSLFPRNESDFSRVTVVLPYGSPIERTEEVSNTLIAGAEKVLEESGHPELVKGIYAELGRGGTHNVFVDVYLGDTEIRETVMSTGEFTSRWRKEVGDLSGIQSLKFQSDIGGPGSGAGLTIQLSHKDIDVLEKASTDLAAELSNYPLVKDIDDGFQPGKEQLDFKIKPEGKSLGLTAQNVARQVRSSFYGAEAVRQQRGRNEVKIMVRLPEDERTSEFNLEELMLRTPSGVEVPLREVVEMERGRSYTTIDRKDGRRVVQVEADVVPQSKALEVQTNLEAEFFPELMHRYPGLVFDYEGKQADMAESMGSLRTGFILAMLAIYVLLAIPFRSYLQPLVVMTSIPFGIIGALIGHLIMGYNLSIISMFGIVALSGVVVNDALVLIDFANRRIRDDGMSVHDAVLDAAVQRFRPIMLTTLTTFCGLAPMIFETSFQARFLIPMAISLGFGIVFATVITLALVPSLYMVIDDYIKAIGKIRAYFSREDSSDLNPIRKEG
jgi:multidrug efflux pump subunit AcrB